MFCDGNNVEYFWLHTLNYDPPSVMRDNDVLISWNIIIAGCATKGNGSLTVPFVDVFLIVEKWVFLA